MREKELNEESVKKEMEHKNEIKTKNTETCPVEEKDCANCEIPDCPEEKLATPTIFV